MSKYMSDAPVQETLNKYTNKSSKRKTIDEPLTYGDKVRKRLEKKRRLLVKVWDQTRSKAINNAVQNLWTTIKKKVDYQIKNATYTSFNRKISINFGYYMTSNHEESRRKYKNYTGVVHTKVEKTIGKNDFDDIIRSGINEILRQNDLSYVYKYLETNSPKETVSCDKF